MTNEEAKALFEEDLKDGKCSNDCLECNAREKAISALDKQIPKKCETREGRMVYRCPSCGKWFAGSVDYMIYFDLGPRFCSICGQALDWDYRKYRLNKERDSND